MSKNGENISHENSGFREGQVAHLPGPVKAESSSVKIFSPLAIMLRSSPITGCARTLVTFSIRSRASQELLPPTTGGGIIVGFASLTERHSLECQLYYC